MRVIIAGSRTIVDYEEVKQAVKDSNWLITEVVSGTANGVDKLGERYANEHLIPIKRFPAQWERWGKAAGMFRNAEMADYADGLILVWDGKSKGSAGMRNIAAMKNMPLFERVVVPQDWF